MQRNPNKLMDGFAALPGGMDSGNDASGIGVNQVSMAVNATFREGFVQTRPALIGMDLVYDNNDTASRFYIPNFQGACMYEAPTGNVQIIMAGGRLFRGQPVGNTLSLTEITMHANVVTTSDFTVPLPGNPVNIVMNQVQPISIGDVITVDGGTYTVTAIFENVVDPITLTGNVNYVTATYGGGALNAVVPAGTAVLDNAAVQIVWWDTNSDSDKMCFMFQAEQYLIILQGKQRPIIYDGAVARRSSIVDEIPAGYCGAYVNGRIWIALPDRRNYVGGDLVGSSSGTAALNYVDAILKTTENTYLNGGGAFSIPAKAGLITAIDATVTLDTSLGQGPVSIFTTKGVFTNNAPVDRTAWADLTYPIQTVSLAKYGPMAPRCVVNVNSDWWYRSLDGARSFIVARRNFGGGWGNTPMSHEMSRVLDRDNKDLLQYGSGVLFNNRLLLTCSPIDNGFGVIHKGLAVINFDEVSSMRTSGNPCWEGLWTGLDIHQIVPHDDDDVEEAWIYARGAAGDLQVWRFDDEAVSDYRTDQNNKIASSRISSFVETRSMNFAQPGEPKRLDVAEFFVDRVAGSVGFDVRFRPDQYPCWICWHAWTECTTVNRCSEACDVPLNNQPGYRPYMKTPQAPESCLPGTVPSRLANRGEEFQVRVAWLGFARIKKMRVHAYMELSNTNGECR